VFVKYAFVSLLLPASVVLAGPQAIGIVTASGHFSVEGSSVWGNATLFDGATIETSAASSEIALRNGVKVQLGKDSRARVWNDRLLLLKGVGQIAAPSTGSTVGFDVNAAGVHVDAAGTRIRVGLTNRVEIASYSGTARVTGAVGVELGTLRPGNTMSFAMQAGVVTRTGCLVYKDGHFLVQDQATQQVIELNGPDLAANVGNRVEVTGTVSTAKPAIAVATAVVNVASVASRAQGGCLSVASALDARTDVPANAAAPAKPTAPGAPAPPAAQPAGQPKVAGTGLSTGAKVGIIAAVGGGAGVGIYVATKKSSTSP
jgi:hypothetical protein